MGIYFWPFSVSRSYTVEAYVDAFEAMGYSECAGAELEKGFVKVAIYADDHGKPQHAARQLDDGQWTSKFGDLEDIEHTLDAFDGSHYGSPVVFLKRSD